MSHNVAVILSGSGVYDGSEIHEAVMLLLALHKAGVAVECFAPNVEQMHVINHLTGDVMGETRNVLVEAARITRGKVTDLASYNPANFDALLMPGGFGAAKNLSSFAVDGADCKVNDDVASAIVATKEAGKVIGAMCIAPVILAKLIPGVCITLGDEGDAASAAVVMGATHQVSSHDIVVDRKNRVVTTPAYMLEANIGEIESDATALVGAVLEMCAR
tara:strand:- start:1704 stop:2357 length:654 start_codon:yes stop_codon:yes gene_type:complete